LIKQSTDDEYKTPLATHKHKMYAVTEKFVLLSELHTDKSLESQHTVGLQKLTV